jgi:hypothetical protein
MAAIPIVMMAGAGISALGALSQANAAQASASYNANLRELDAGVALDQANRDAVQVRRAGQMAQGSALAGYGASGVATDEGSPLDVLSMSAGQAKLDEETVLYKGRMKASGYQSAAALERFGGKTAKRQGYLNAASYLIGGAGQAAYTHAMVQRPFLYGE